MCHTQGSPKGKGSQGNSIPPSEENLDLPSRLPPRVSTSKKSLAKTGESSGQVNKVNPRVTLIPAIKKKGVDFQNPPNSLP